MTPERWARVKEIFSTALARPKAERPAFLDGACGADAPLRAEVERLLAEEDSASLISPGAELLGQTALPDLSAGEMLAHYRIEAKLGEGGMGAVYRGYDSQLRRPVALKVLPPGYASDPAWRERLLREARAASALNHPNIVGIYEVGSDNGVDFIAMEFVEGKTLIDVIPAKGLPLGKALDYAVQIAGGLAKAHSAGVVHRDLKPGNIMVTDDGLVKLLDFGLARRVLLGPEHDTTLTVEGEILGTPAYMSPEQAQGKPVDARSDVFSFGSVLYQMVTGRRAFEKDSHISTLAAVVEQEPRPLPSSVPRDLKRIIARCLPKDPARRFQHMDDVKVELEELKEDSDSGRLAALPAPGTRFRGGVRLPTWAARLLIVILVAVTATLAWRLGWRSTPSQAPILTRLTSDSGFTTEPALSPDGKLLAYASDRAGEDNLDIWVQQVGGGEPIRLTRDPADEAGPTFSPDGTQVVFRSGTEIRVVPALGGSVRKVAAPGYDPQFSPDGKWIAYSSECCSGISLLSLGDSKIFVMASTGGAPRQIQPRFATANNPVWSLDSKRLLFLGSLDRKLPLQQSIDWWVTPLEAGDAKRTGILDIVRGKKLIGPVDLYPDALAAPAWGPDGRSLVFSARSGDSTNLWAIGIDPDTLKATGSVERLTFGTGEEVGPAAALKLPGTYRLAFASVNYNVHIWSLPVDANRGLVTGAVRRLTDSALPDFHPFLSADGERMTFVSGGKGNQQVWIKNLGSGEQHALTFTPGDRFFPILSPDGSKVSYDTFEGGRPSTHVMPAGGGAPERDFGEYGPILSWAPDGNTALMGHPNGRIGLLELSNGTITELMAYPDCRVYGPSFSPDGRWITFMAGGGTWVPSRIYVAPFRDRGLIGQNEWIAVSKGEDSKPRWSPDGNLLYYASLRDGFYCLYAQRLDPATKRPAGAPLAVYHSHDIRRSTRYVSVLMFEFSLARNRLAFSMAERTGNIWMAEFKH